MPRTTTNGPSRLAEKLLRGLRLTPQDAEYAFGDAVPKGFQVTRVMLGAVVVLLSVLVAWASERSELRGNPRGVGARRLRLEFVAWEGMKRHEKACLAGVSKGFGSRRAPSGSLGPRACLGDFVSFWTLSGLEPWHV